MGEINIHHPHNMPMPQARKAVEEAARRLAGKFDIEYAWNGDVLDFQRAGVDGRIALLPDALHVNAKLGFFLSALQGPIEHEIRRALEERFSA